VCCTTKGAKFNISRIKKVNRSVQFLRLHILYSLGRIKEKGFTQRVEKKRKCKKGERHLQYGQKLDDKGVNRENNEILIVFLMNRIMGHQELT